MPEYTHGGDIWDREGLLDFSSNLHPLGMPREVERAAREAVAQAVHYPDPFCRALRQAIGQREGLPPDHVICGAGAADLILRLCLVLEPRRGLVTAPTFSEYEAGLGLRGCRVERYPLSPERDFDLDEGILGAITPGLDVLFLCTPNNPTGRLIPTALLEEILGRCRATGTRLVLDECFLELTDGRSMAFALEEYPNLFLLRAFTKSYAIPGLRLGYGLTADRALLERLYAVGQPWSVSNVAQAAGVAACGLPQWPRRGREVLETSRPLLRQGLADLGLRVFPGQANYLLFRAPGVEDLKERLLDRGVLIRACGNYPGLGPDYYRVCVKTQEANGALLRALQEVL